MFLNPTADPVRFATSWLLNAHHLALLRALFSLYAFVVLIVSLVYYSAVDHDPALAGQEFSYFTIITYWGLAFYFAFSAFHSATYWFRGRPALAGWGAVLIQLHSIFYSTIVVYPFIVTIVFWGLLYSPFPTRETLWKNVSEHALNSFFALCEVFLTRTDPLPWIHLLWLLIMLALYVGVAYITKASEGFYVYSFLDPTLKGGRGRVTGYVFGILALSIVAFIIVKYVILLRQWITETKLRKTGKLGWRGDAFRQGSVDNVEEAEKVAV